MTNKETAMSKHLEVAREMPRLEYNEFRPKSSEALNWIKEQPELQIWVFENLRSRGLIRYSRVFEKWEGVPEEDSK